MFRELILRFAAHELSFNGIEKIFLFLNGRTSIVWCGFFFTFSFIYLKDCFHGCVVVIYGVDLE